MRILVTGGTGFIGSHSCIALIEAGHEVVCIDNLSNSSKQVRAIVREITGIGITLYEHDVSDEVFLTQVMKKEKIDACIHLAGLKSVSESIKYPGRYYRNNINGTLAVLKAMRRAGVWNLIFSSSAVVYGEQAPPVSELTPLRMPASPYGKTKLMIEHILQDHAAADERWNFCILRYFNPVGAHPSGKLGENPKDTPNNLMPLIVQAAAGEAVLQVFGGDYPTPDGSCIRDYIHIQDLAQGHVSALQSFHKCGVTCYNLGRGEGISVLELISAFEEVNNVMIPYEVVSRRSGDIVSSFAMVEKAKKELDWVARHDVKDMVRDSWNWKLTNSKRKADNH